MMVTEPSVPLGRACQRAENKDREDYYTNSESFKVFPKEKAE